jgi:hypothetical protein
LCVTPRARRGQPEPIMGSKQRFIVTYEDPSQYHKKDKNRK